MQKTYAELSKEFKPHKLVEDALTYVKNTGDALDVGAGSLRNTKYLLERGFRVVAVDKDEFIESSAKEINNDDLSAFCVDITEWDFPENEFDLVIAINSLPFLHPNNFEKVFEKIKCSLKPGGVFCFTLFGNKDSWATNTERTFFSRNEVEELISDMNTHLFVEEEEDGKSIRGDDKHWHIFKIIVQK